MTPADMEEHSKNLNQWAGEVAQYLPQLATKKDLAQAIDRAIAPLATKEDVEASKRYTENLIFVTRREIRQLDDKVSSMAHDVKRIAEQVAILTMRRRKP